MGQTEAKKLKWKLKSETLAALPTRLTLRVKVAYASALSTCAMPNVTDTHTK